jgi:glycosyltransferase involved in cell wall biosynthesis
MRRAEVTRVMFFTSHLGGGGAEKHLVRVAGHLDPDRFEVTVVAARGGGVYESELPAHVRLLSLGTPSMLGAIGPLRALIRRERPDVLCSVMDHANCAALLATRLLPGAPPVVACVQIPAAIELRRTPGKAARVLRQLIPRLYPRAAAVIALSEGVRRDLEAWIPALRGRVEVIYNAGVDPGVVALGKERGALPTVPAGEPVLVACGRLTEQKGFTHLLNALAEVRRHVPAHLWLVGEGPLRDALREEAARLGVGDAVWFAGFQRNPFQYMAAADIFVLSSLWEGFGNVLVEAMALGTPVVATACPHGPDEIITHDETGCLVPCGDPAALAREILRVLRDPALAQRLADAGRSRAQAFAAPRIAAAYGDFLARIASAPVRQLAHATES